MTNNRTFQLSCRLFWGYKTTIDLDYIDTTNDIVKTITNRLDLSLRDLNLIFLTEELAKIDFHSPSIETILLEYQPNDIVYICDHNCSNHQLIVNNSC